MITVIFGIAVIAKINSSAIILIDGFHMIAAITRIAMINEKVCQGDLGDNVVRMGFG